MNEWTDRQYVMLSNVSTEEIFYVSNVDVHLIGWAIARKGNHVFNKMGLKDISRSIALCGKKMKTSI